MRKLFVIAALASFMCLTAGQILAQDYQARDEILAKYTDAAGKIAQLVEAMPDENLGWRPMEGVRSFSEAAMHFAGANYFFASKFGEGAPDGVNPREFESITDRAELVSTLDASIKHVQVAFKAARPHNAGMEKPLFGEMTTTEMGAMLLALSHANEHLGQLIAYCRANEVAPPWSQ